jgi:hypothetical protein
MNGQWTNITGAFEDRSAAISVLDARNKSRSQMWHLEARHSPFLTEASPNITYRYVAI